MCPRTSKPEWEQGSVDGSIDRFPVGAMRQRTRRLSRQLPVPPRESNVLHRCRPPGESAVRTPAPLPGHPLPTTGLGGREVACEGGEGMEAIEMERRAGRNRQLTEGDRELVGFLAVCRESDSR